MELRERMRARLPKAGWDGKWYEISNAAGDNDEPAVIRLYQEIGYWGVTAEDFARELDAVSASTIEVWINSPGGDVFDGIAIYNVLRAHSARVITRVDGIAASAASVIAQAGDHRVMLESAQMMIHEAWGLAIGPADEIRAFADILDQQNEVIAGVYASRSGGDAEAFRALMSAETWLTDEQTVELGLADEVVVPERQEAAAANTTVIVKIDGPAIAAAIAATQPKPAATFDATDHVDRPWVREMFGSTALAD